jgi:Fe-S-cluster containining protein
MCCQGANPPLSENRKKIITDYLLKNHVAISGLFVEDEYSHPSADSEEYCAFFNKKTGKCSVHPVKPETCVAGPITFDINLKTKKVEWFLKKANICAFAQKLFEDKDRFNEHLKAAQPELMRLISELDRKALGAIMKIPEPETFKVAENDLPKETKSKLGIT